MKRNMLKLLILTFPLFLILSQVDALSIKGIKLSPSRNSEIRIPQITKLNKLSEIKVFDKDTKAQRIEQIKESGKKKTLTGRLNTIIHDDFENKKSEIEYSLTTDEINYIIYDNNSVVSQLDSGNTLNIESLSIGNELVPLEISPAEKLTTKQPIRNDRLGEQRLALILVNFRDNPSTPLTKEESYNNIFNETNFDSLSNYIKENSYDEAFVTGNVFGWYAIPLNTSELCVQGGFDKVLNASIYASNNDIDFSNYDHIMITTVDTGGCSPSANLGKMSIYTPDGVFNLSASIINGYTNLNIKTTAHEFGHQLGLRHANGWDCDSKTIGNYCKSINYKDVFDIMGNTYGKGQYNSFHKEALGWFRPSEIVETKKEGTYIVNPLELSGGIKMLKIPTNKTFYYSIEYRRPIGHDSINQDIWGTNIYNGAIIHTNVTNKNRGYDTQLLDTTPSTNNIDFSDWADSVLVPGKVFTDTGNNIAIKVIRATDKYLEICFGQANCRT